VEVILHESTKKNGNSAQKDIFEESLLKLGLFCMLKGSPAY